MKKQLSYFGDFALNRAEMKSVGGGVDIWCRCDYPWGSQLGRCSGPNPDTCESYGCNGGGVMKGCDWQGGGSKFT